MLMRPATQSILLCVCRLRSVLPSEYNISTTKKNVKMDEVLDLVHLDVLFLVHQRTVSVPQVFPVYQIPGGLLMPHPTDYDPLIRDEKDPEAITKDNVRKMAFFPELEIMMRIEERTDRIVFYHPESNQSKVIRPVFELGASKNHQRTGLVSGGGGAGKSILMMKMQKNPT